MPRLDRNRLDAWRDLARGVGTVERSVDAALRAEWAVPLASFEVLDSIRRLGGRARPQNIADDLGVPRSSLSRRIDRLEEEGWVERSPDERSDDHRAVAVDLTERGRTLWRAMLVTYRRSVQAGFASRLTDDEIDALRAIVARLP